MAGRRRPGRFGRRCAAVIAVLALAGSLADCGATPAYVGAPDGPTIAIGVAVDEPGVGWWHDGRFSGFDVTVARYVADALGYADKQIVFTPVTPQTASGLLGQGRADLLVSALPVGESGRFADARDAGNGTGNDAGDEAGNRSGSVSASTAGPGSDVPEDVRDGAEDAGSYLVAPQQLLVHRDDVRTMASMGSLAGKVVCTVLGSGGAAALTKALPGVVVRPRPSYPQCLTALMVGEADAVSADGAVLAGLARGYGSDYLGIVRRPLASVAHGVRVKAGNARLARKVNEALRAMRRDGSWARAVRTLEEETGYRVEAGLNGVG
ncbi:MAG: transporter substrate-binding domain-containing protein [Bifidobacterium mongoliense]|jgi:glutamate transport system substrate-binding protein